MLTDRHTGFTLLDLMMAMAVIVVVAAIATPRYANALTRYRAEAAARRVAADLGLARQTAKSTSSSRTIGFNPGNHSYVIPNVRELDSAGTMYRVQLQDPPYQAQIVSVDFGGDATLIFDGFGIPDSGGFVIVQAGDYQYTVVVDPETGAAQVQ